MRLSQLLLAVSMASSGWAADAAGLPHRYYAHALEFGLPYAINNAGQVVGTNGWDAYISGPKGKGATKLGSFGLYNVPRDINDLGVVVGKSNGKAYITDPGGANMREIVMPEENADAEARYVNNAGQVVGQYLVPRPPSGYETYYFITDPGGLNARRFEAVVPGFTVIQQINSSGQVVGWMGTDVSLPPVPFVTGPNATGIFEIDRTGSGYDYASPTAINDAGQVAGMARQSFFGVAQPFVANPGRPIRVKSPLGHGARFSAMNGHGDTVGTSLYGSRGRQRAYIAGFASRLVPIDTMVQNMPPSASFNGANDINDRRQVVVFGTGGYILCPTENCE